MGGVISPVLFCLYVDGLLILLSDAKVSCYIGHVFGGTLAYADDIVLLAPTAMVIRKLLSFCDEFARGLNVLFNAKKSKCLYIRNKEDNRYNCCLKPMFNIGGNAIEFVQQWPHLGKLINDILDDKDDILKKRNTMCGQINNVLYFVGKVDAVIKTQLLNICCSSLCGSLV